ncbi:MAG: TetR/AcrR family transcriptional regulator [Planctomycetota bacterium]
MTEPVPRHKAELLVASERLFSDRGYEATTVRDIADALGLQPGSLYAHIQTKEDLLWEILESAADRFFDAVRPVVESDLLTLEKLRRAIAAHVGVITQSARAAAIYSTEWRHLGETRRREFASRRDAYERMFRTLVHDAVCEGVFGDVDEKFGALLILSSINWVYQWYKPDGPMPPEEIARRITDLLFNGMKRAGR